MWTDSVLDAMRQVGDPVADSVIADVFGASDVTRVNDLMRNLIANEYPVPETLPDNVRAYLARTDQLPDWADTRLLEQGGKIFFRFGPEMLLILLNYSLPFCYLDAKGVNVLALTTRLVSNPTRRVIETAQMLVDVMSPGGLTDPQGRGRRTIQKVRLMHAAVRRLAAHAPAWQPEWDLPINQEDLALTLLSFSWVIVDGLEKFEIRLSDAEKEAYLHTWLVIGSMLGIDPTLLPANFAEAKLLKEIVARRRFASSDAGQELTRALIDMIVYILPGDLLRKTPPAFVKHFLGEPWADWLGVVSNPLVDVIWLPLKALGVVVGDVTGEPGVLRALAGKLGRLLVHSIVLVSRGGTRPSFSIPSELRQTWGVNWLS